MIFLLTAAAALLLQSASPSLAPADPMPVNPIDAPAVAADDFIAAAAIGLVAQIEDDNNPGGDLQLVSMKSDGCKTVITGALITEDSNTAATRTWTVDWAVPGSVAPGDTFIFIDVAPVKIAIVGDASKPDQAAKLSAMFAAMFETQLDCTTQF